MDRIAELAGRHLPAFLHTVSSRRMPGSPPSTTSPTTTPTTTPTPATTTPDTDGQVYLDPVVLTLFIFLIPIACICSCICLWFLFKRMSTPDGELEQIAIRKNEATSLTSRGSAFFPNESYGPGGSTIDGWDSDNDAATELTTTRTYETPTIIGKAEKKKNKLLKVSKKVDNMMNLNQGPGSDITTTGLDSQGIAASHDGEIVDYEEEYNQEERQIKKDLDEYVSQHPDGLIESSSSLYPTAGRGLIPVKSKMVDRDELNSLEQAIIDVLNEGQSQGIGSPSYQQSADSSKQPTSSRDTATQGAGGFKGKGSYKGSAGKGSPRFGNPSPIDGRVGRLSPRATECSPRAASASPRASSPVPMLRKLPEEEPTSPAGTSLRTGKALKAVPNLVSPRNLKKAMPKYT